MRRSRPANISLRVLRCSVLALTPALALAGLLPCFGQQMHRNDFETSRTSWIKGAADVDYEETAHTMTDQTAHQGQRSEYIQINAKQGSHIYYYYPTAKAPIADDLTISIWVKSNHPGIQLMARVVLPKEADPSSLQDRLTTVIRGDSYRTVGAWRRLEIPRVVKLAQAQQQLMQLQLGRQVNFQDAYVDKLILNVYGGSGVTDVWIDELEVGPVYETPAPKGAAAPAVPGAPATAPATASAGFVNFKGPYIEVDNKRFFFRGIRCTDTPPKNLRDAGFNTLFVDTPWDPAKLRQMVDLGFWLVPTLPVNSTDARLVSGDNLPREVLGFPELDNVLFWYLGTGLRNEELSLVDRCAKYIQTADRQHPHSANVWDGVARYSNTLNMVSIHRWPLMTTLELTQYKDWLQGHANLANPHAFLWTWIQTQTPDVYTQLWYQKPGTAEFAEPIGPQPEQIRLLTYLAVGSGFRGIGYWSDRFLAVDHQGTDRLLTVALLNQELEMLEPLLTTSDDTKRAEWIDTSDVNVKAAVLRTKRGILVLPMWLGSSAQFVPGQAAISKLTITVPMVRDTDQCYEVTPGEVRNLRLVNGATGGMTVTVPEFGLTTALVFTPDISLIEQFQVLCYGKKQSAAKYTYDLAMEEKEKVTTIEGQLEKAGHTLPDSAALMKDADKRLQTAKDYLDQHQYGEAYREAQRAVRPLRILMRAQWETAIRQLTTPVASPYAVSFYTLPRHWEFMEQVTACKPGKNLLDVGDFETVPGRSQAAWEPYVPQTLDDVEMKAELATEMWIGTTNLTTKKAGPRVKLNAKEGKQFAVLTILPKGGPAKDSDKGKDKDKDRPALPRALDRTFLAFNSPQVKLPPGSLVKISGWMAVPDNILASQDGALVFDSAGSVELAYRMTAKSDGWKQFALYRRVPETGPEAGTIRVTIAMTGLGQVAFDDIRIEPMIPK